MKDFILMADAGCDLSAEFQKKYDIKIIDGQNGLFVAMPSRKMGEGDFRDIAHPLLSETRNRIKDAIFAEYEKLLSENEAASAADEIVVEA